MSADNNFLSVTGLRVRGTASVANQIVYPAKWEGGNVRTRQRIFHQLFPGEKRRKSRFRYRTFGEKFELFVGEGSIGKFTKFCVEIIRVRLVEQNPQNRRASERFFGVVERSTWMQVRWRLVQGIFAWFRNADLDHSRQPRLAMEFAGTRVTRAVHRSEESNFPRAYGSRRTQTNGRERSRNFENRLIRSRSPIEADLSTYRRTLALYARSYYCDLSLRLQPEIGNVPGTNGNFARWLATVVNFVKVMRLIARESSMK